MLRITSSGTYSVLKQVLINQHFIQKEIIQKTGLSKGRVSQIINWLRDKEFLMDSGQALELTNAKKLLRLFFLLRDIEPVFETRVECEDFSKLTDDLSDLRIVLCESSALCFYDLYCTHKELDFYVNKDRIEEVKKRLKRKGPGDFKVKAYLSDLPLENDIHHIKDYRLTGEVRTVIDLYALGKRGEAERLMNKIWPID